MKFHRAAPSISRLAALPIAFIIGVTAAAFTEAFGPAVAARETLFDFYQRISPRDPLPANAPNRAVFIDIDAASLDRLGPLPWPRTRLAGLARAASESGARAIVIDMPLDGDDALSPENILPIWSEYLEEAEILSSLAAAPSHDAILAAALRETPAIAVAYGAKAGRKTAPAQIYLGPPLAIDTGGARLDALPLPRGVIETAPKREIIDAARSLGVAAFPQDRDGRVRRTPLLWRAGDELRSGVVVDAARVAEGVETIRLAADSSAIWGPGAKLTGISVGARAVATYPDGSMRLYFPRNITPQRLPAWRVLSGEAGSEFLRDRIAVIGSSEPGAGALLATPRGELSRSAAIAAAIDQFFSGVSVGRPVWSLPLEAGGALVFGVILVFAAQRLRVPHAAALTLAVISLGLFGSWFAFDQARMLLDPWPLTAAALIALGAVAGARSFKEIMDHEAVRSASNDSLPPAAVAAIAEKGPAALLDGARRPLAILSCEIRSALELEHAYAEKPEILAKLIRSATTHMRNHILQCGGAVDMTEGGRMTGVWNAPLEEPNFIQAACAAALSLVESLDDLNGKLEESAELMGGRFTPIHLGIGLSSGPCFIGAVSHGAQTRYSPIGAPANIASLLRMRSGLYGPAIIVDEEVYRETHHRFAYLEVDYLEMPGRPRAERIYALLGNPFIKASPRFRAVDDAQRDILDAYRAGDWAQAKALLEDARKLKGANPALFELYEQRIHRYETAPPPSDWDGAERAFI